MDVKAISVWSHPFLLGYGSYKLNLMWHGIITHDWVRQEYGDSPMFGEAHDNSFSLSCAMQ